MPHRIYIYIHIYIVSHNEFIRERKRKREGYNENHDFNVKCDSKVQNSTNILCYRKSHAVILSWALCRKHVWRLSFLMLMLDNRTKTSWTPKCQNWDEHQKPYHNQICVCLKQHISTCHDIQCVRYHWHDHFSISRQQWSSERFLNKTRYRKRVPKDLNKVHLECNLVACNSTRKVCTFQSHAAQIPWTNWALSGKCL